MTNPATGDREPTLEWMFEREKLLRDLEYHISSSEQGICRVPRAVILRALSALQAPQYTGGVEATTCPKCGSTEAPTVVSGTGLRATCRGCGYIGGYHEYTP